MILYKLIQVSSQRPPLNSQIAPDNLIAALNTFQLTLIPMPFQLFPNKNRFTPIRTIDDFVLAHLFMILQILVHNPVLASNITAPHFSEIASQLMLLQVSSQTKRATNSSKVVDQGTIDL